MFNSIFKKIEIDDKKIFDYFFSNNIIEISEYTFTNLFVWSDSRIVEYAIYNDILITKASFENEQYFLPPVGPVTIDTYITLRDYAIKNNITSIKRVDLNTIERLNLKDKFRVVEDRDNFDYVYDSTSLIELKGSKYSSKRGFVKKFLDTYDYEYREFDEKYKNDCLMLTEKWFSNKNNNDKTLKNEFIAIKRLLEFNKELKIAGGLIFIEDKLRAFAFGERLNHETFVIHFEKADTNFVGIYQTINKLFIEKECYNKFKFVNREQDLGIEGIRKAKESYHPIKMIKKYNLYFDKV
ncbi:MAG TPA: phosphatidylglycerol lysyltransferase domain-containing protein [Spirochaetota bacterium]|nr:phosphatidylglycerol lysyltransferase domain-containing protein [Spirochaetota bacterium]HOL56329.1 phosphatidylglycerol lysyltransferase domain-containing protein [Spirochaetota bacterium]HPP03554.1 phosphatidylglycerol lysyltransferase domain-containing protein [Spirochaetota bacterium]